MKESGGKRLQRTEEIEEQSVREMEDGRDDNQIHFQRFFSCRPF